MLKAPKNEFGVAEAAIRLSACTQSEYSSRSSISNLSEPLHNNGENRAENQDFEQASSQSLKSAISARTSFFAESSDEDEIFELKSPKSEKMERGYLKY